MKKVIYFLFSWVSEIFLFSIYPFGLLVSIFPLLKKKEPMVNNSPVIIVDDWFAYNAWHPYMKNYLRKKGLNVYGVNYSLILESYEKTALRLKKFIEENDLHNVTLVGISLRAVVIFVYLQRHNGWERVNKFVSIGGPFRGTWATIFVTMFRFARQILPPNPFVKNLLRDPIKNPERIICLSAKFDELVPGWSSSLPGAQNYTIDILGHNNMHTHSREVFDHIVKAATQK